MSHAELSLIDLFRDEVKSHAAALGSGLLELERTPGDARKVEPLMRAAHSIKGAARIVGLEAVVELAHVMEDALVAAQHGRIVLTSGDIDGLLRGGDLLAELGEATEAGMEEWGGRHQAELGHLRERFVALARGETARSASERSVPEPVAHAPGSDNRTTPAIPHDPITPGDDEPMFDLFREEVRVNALALHDGLTASPQPIEALLHAAAALRGAARIVGLNAVASVASSMEALLSSMKEQQAALDSGAIDLLLGSLARFAELIPLPAEKAIAWVKSHESDLVSLRTALDAMQSRPVVHKVTPIPSPSLEEAQPPARLPAPEQGEAVVRVTAQSLNRLMSLAGESLVQARWLQPFAMALVKLKKHQDRLAGLIDHLADAVTEGRRPEQLETSLEETRRQLGTVVTALTDRIREFEDHAARAEDLTRRLYREVIVSRMRPFADGAHGFPRLVRDMARQLDKQVRLVIEGLTTEVDRDILEKLEAPLMHLLRNAVDHGIEPPEERRAAGKAEEGVLKLEVRHSAGMLAISVRDDGGGIDLDRLKGKVIERGLTTPEMARDMGEAELLEFLFLPGFSTASSLTEYSGRGVGLDVVQDTIRKVGGSVRITSRRGVGTSFHLQMPITLSVLRAVLVDIAGEAYAFPHNRIDRLLRVKRSAVRSLEHRHFVTVDGSNVGLVLASADP